jgi:hypothetical protein
LTSKKRKSADKAPRKRKPAAKVGMTPKEYAACATLKCTGPKAGVDFACEECIEQVIAKALSRNKTIPRGKGFEWFKGEIDRDLVREGVAIQNLPDPIDQVAEAIYERLFETPAPCLSLSLPRCQPHAMVVRWHGAWPDEIKAAIRETLRTGGK